MTKTAILYKTHLINRYIKKNYFQLMSSCPTQDVWILLHAEKQLPIRYPWPQRLYTFNSNQVKAAGYRFNDFWHCGHYPALLFYLENPGYDYYWMIEYDVEYTGHWGLFLNSFGNEDFLATYVRSFAQKPDWMWWKSLEIDSPQLDRQYWMSALFPIVRFSRRALQTLHCYHREGYFSHAEAIVPSIMKREGFSMADINQTCPSSAGYYSEQSFWYEKRKWWPYIKKRNQLYHPVYGWTSNGFMKWCQPIFAILRRLRHYCNRAAIYLRSSDEFRAFLKRRQSGSKSEGF
jgi:hypothetical protein